MEAESNEYMAPVRDADLAKEFLDEEYRHTWAEDYLDTTLALQIAALRRQRDWNQTELAKRAGTAQSAVSRMEDVGYGAHSIRVLKQLAVAFGLRLKVSFEEFGTLILESAEFAESGLNRHSFHDDPHVAKLLAAQGLSQPPQPVIESVGADALPIAEAPPSPIHPLTFAEELEIALAGPLPDRIPQLRKWLMGYGLPSGDEPVYKQLYFSISPDHRHAPSIIFLAEACAELLLPEQLGEILSDPDDGEYAVENLLRLSAMLAAGANVITASCHTLFPWLGGQWNRVSEPVKDAVIDLAFALGRIDLAERILDWPREAALDNRSKLMLSFLCFSREPRNKGAKQRLAYNFDPEVRRDANDPFVQAISDKVILVSATPEDAKHEREMDPKFSDGNGSSRRT